MINKPSAFVESLEGTYDSIVIVEFKRPERGDYDDFKNPITQVYDYVKTIRNNKMLDLRGKTINISSETAFFCYILADLTAKLVDIAVNYSFTRTADYQGFFGYNDKINTYVEIISFDKLLRDADKRNHAIFKQLRLT